jgi:putative peptidoglycan lipid II flippase
VFYALTDSRTATLVQLFTVAVKIPLMLACPVLLPPDDVVLGIAAANSASFLAGAGLGHILLRRKLGRVRSGSVLSTTVRSLVASLAAALLAYGAVALLDLGPFAALSPLARSWSVLGVAVVVGGPVTVLGMWLLRVREVETLVHRLERLVDRRNARRRSAA